MPKKTATKIKVDADPKRALAVLRRLKKEFPDAKCALDHETPHQLLAATILSAQCTDKRVNLVTQDLFAKYRNVAAFAHADQAEMEQDVKSTGFFRNKATSLIRMSRDVLEKHGGEVPQTRAELKALPGVGRKTANVMLNTAFGQPTIAVDTHIFRVCNRIGLARGKTPLEVEKKLLKFTPDEFKQDAHHWLILHGRYCCKARKPLCAECIIEDLCEYNGK